MSAEVRDASVYLDRGTAEKYMETNGVQFVADLVRAKALLLGGPRSDGGVSPPGGWFIDGDTVWLKPAPVLQVGDPATVGHFFASLSASKSIRGKSRDEFDKHWAVHYLREPWDLAYLASPFAFPEESPVLARWICDMEARAGRRGDYCDSFAELATMITALGLEGAIVGKEVCSPLCRFLGDRVLQASETEVLLPTVDFSTALCVNNFWQSTKSLKSGETAEQKGDTARIEPGSMWAHVLQLAADRAGAQPQKRGHNKSTT